MANNTTKYFLSESYRNPNIVQGSAPMDL